MDRRILIHCIAGGPFGIGHLSRCLTLADALRDRGVAPTFLLFKGEPSVEGWVKDRGYAVHTLPSAGVPPECGPVVEVFERSDFSLLILDGYIFETPYLDDLDGAGVPTLYMDDMMSLAYPCPLVFNQNFYARPEYFRIRNGTRLLLGPRYALVREEFRQARGNLHRTGRGEMRRLLVTGGGGDATGQTGKVLEALGGLETELDVTVVVGPINPALREIQRRASLLDRHRVQVLQNVERMSTVMERADFVVSAAGTTCMELCVMGLSGLLIETSPLERRIGEGLQAQGLFVNLGWHEEVSADRIREALESFIADPAPVRAMSDRSFAAVDGLGAIRLAGVIEDYIGPAQSQFVVEARIPKN
jgi:UDP-2,4-diacetamido-2,4,6-trideoxy-beta-L-altropyranose hydrolase